VDTVAWALANGGITAVANKQLSIKIPITLQTVNAKVDSGFTLAIKNSAGATITSPADLIEVETAVDPNDILNGKPFTGKIETTTYPTVTTGSLSIVGNTDGVGT